MGNKALKKKKKNKDVAPEAVAPVETRATSGHSVIRAAAKRTAHFLVPFWPLFIAVFGYIAVTTLLWSAAEARASQRIQSVRIIADDMPLDIYAGDSRIEQTRASDIIAICSSVVNKEALQQNVCKELFEQLERCPWIRKTMAVRRDLTDRIVVEIKLRRPVAALCSASEECLISDDNVRLPWDVSAFRPKHLARIYVNDGLLPRKAGDAIVGEPISKTVEIIDAVSAYSIENNLNFEIVAARLRPVGETSALILYTNIYDIRIEWGAVLPVSEEPSVHTKLTSIQRRLRENAARLDQIDALIVKDERAPVRLKTPAERLR
ncbi:MAG: hypothetical protein ABIH86_06100 [Planctomycetota bacterium]